MLNTFDSSFTRDMVMDPPVVIRLALTAEELDTIYWKVREIRFFEQPMFYKFVSRPGRRFGSISPESKTVWVIRSGGRLHEVHRSSEFCVVDDPDEKRLGSLHLTVENMVMRKPEFKALPRPRGAYL